MLTFTFKNRIILLLVVLVGFTTACKKKDSDDPQPSSSTAFRKNTIDYSTLTATTSYKTAFKNEAGDTTVNRDKGRTRLRMFRALAAYVGSSITNNVDLDSATMSNMFANKNNPFTGIYADLNTAGFNIKDVTASTISATDKADVLDGLEEAFGYMARISKSRAQAAVKGTAGKHSTGNYILDEAGIEWAQIIQKTLIGAYHLDYIGNVLLNTGLNADNTTLVAGTKSTQLELNWDEAYGFLSFNDIYGSKATAVGVTPASSGETYLGSYAWEYNKDGYVKLHGAFLKGRAAIHNNDMTEVKAQAKIIREILEYSIGAAANGYMGKSVGAPHSFGEGLGFIYSTPFCKLTGTDMAFADDLIDDLFITDETTFYDITAAQYTTVKNKLIAKFNIQ